MPSFKRSQPKEKRFPQKVQKVCRKRQTGFKHILANWKNTRLVSVRPSELAQLFEIYSRIPIEWSAFNRLPYLTSLQQLRGQKLDFFFVKNEQGNPVGACGIRLDHKRKRMLIARIFVLPEFQRSGHGQNLMQALFAIGHRSGMRKAYGFVSAAEHSMALNELKMMLSLGCTKSPLKPLRFPNGLFWLIEKDLTVNK